MPELRWPFLWQPVLEDTQLEYEKINEYDCNSDRNDIPDAMEIGTASSVPSTGTSKLVSHEEYTSTYDAAAI